MKGKACIGMERAECVRNDVWIKKEVEQAWITV